jgi:hypothetical protein
MAKVRDCGLSWSSALLTAARSVATAAMVVPENDHQGPSEPVKSFEISERPLRVGLMTPATVHHDHAEQTHAAGSAVLDAAYTATPERFIRRPPRPPALPAAASINKHATGRPTTKHATTLSHPA